MDGKDINNIKPIDREQFLPKLKLVLSLIGGLLSFVGFMFVSVRLVKYADQLEVSRLQSTDWFALSALSILYAIINVALVLAWRQILSSLNVGLGFWQATHIYGISQLAKYVPGNIFHLAGRQVLGMAIGLPGWALAKSCAWELGLIAGAASLFGLLALPMWWQCFPTIAALCSFVMVLITVCLAARRWLKFPIAFVLGWYVLFLTVSGLIFVQVLSLISSVSMTIELMLGLLGAFVVAWLTGLVTPGAPAGVGVRELVLLFFLKGFVAEADLLLAVAIGRAVTLVGDFIFFVVAAGLRIKSVNYA